MLCLKKRMYQNISCDVQSDEMMSSSSFITVEFLPTFLKNKDESTVFETVKHGKSYDLNCESVENPKAKVNWFYSAVNEDADDPLDNLLKRLKLTNMTSTREGFYK